MVVQDAIQIELANNIALISRATTAVFGNTELGIGENKHIFDELHQFIRLLRGFEQGIFVLAI